MLNWRRKWQSTPVFLPGKSHGWRRPTGYSSWGCKESDTTEDARAVRMTDIVNAFSELAEKRLQSVDRQES